MENLTDEQKAAKAKAMFTSKKSSSFIANTGLTDEERAAALEAYKNSKFSKSLTAEEIMAIDPLTGAEGKWVRPKIKFDSSSEHVPPPPKGPVPTYNQVGGGKVPMPVISEGKAAVKMVRATSGVFKAGATGATRSSLSAMTDEQKAAMAKSMFKSKKSSSFIANTGLTDEERAAALEAYKNSKFSKSLTAEEIMAIDPLTGAEGKWVRPKITFDASSEHVPPPPMEHIPEELLKEGPGGGGKVPMPVAEDGKVAIKMVRAASGVYRPPKNESVKIPSINVEVIS